MNRIQCKIKRTDSCKDKNAGNKEILIYDNIDTKRDRPSLSVDLLTCGGYPSRSPHWQVGLVVNSNQQSINSTVWTGGNVTFLTPSDPANPSTKDFSATIAPTSAGYFYVSVTTMDRCGDKTYATGSFYTDDCDGVLTMSGNSNSEGPLHSIPVFEAAPGQLNKEIGKMTIEISDMAGNVVHKQTTYAEQDAKDMHQTLRYLPEGIYIERSLSGDQVVSIRKILIR